MRTVLRGISRIAYSVVLAGAIAVLLGCNATFLTQDEPVPVTATPFIEPAPTQDSRWKTVATGIEVRDISLSPYAGGSIPVVRIDPAVAAFRVGYRPGEALSLEDWGALLPDADVIVNAAFFDETDYVLGLLVSDGQVFGQSFSGFGGMFQVSQAGVRVRSLVAEPYYGEALLQAVQAFPMLIEVGGVIGPQGAGFDEKARRTWIGQDFQGRILISMSQYFLSLEDLQSWLAESDLDLTVAFGLDGGRSSGLMLRSAGNNVTYPAFDRLPSVIAVYSP